MKKCYKCNVLINSNIAKCPLCKSNVEDDHKDESVFPIIPNMYAKHTLFLKILLFISIFGSIVCLILNYIINDKIGWSWFVVAGIFSFWIICRSYVNINSIHIMGLFYRMAFLEYYLCITILMYFVCNDIIFLKNFS